MSTHPQPAPIEPSGKLARELYQRSRAGEYGISCEQFAQILSQVTAKYLAGKGERGAVETLLRGLKLEELALARGCAEGNEHAWEIFLSRYRGLLFDAARGITREESSARELADSLYAELYGLGDGESRKSKLRYYTGRGSLEGWLRTVLAQEYVNLYRSRRRFDSLEEQEEAGKQFAAAAAQPQAAPAPQVAPVTDRVLAELEAEDRYLLAAYYLDGRTLAEIGSILGVHESTISRRVEKLAVKLRKKIVEGLVAGGMSSRQAQEALEADVRDLAVDVRGRLTNKDAAAGQESGMKAFPGQQE